MSALVANTINITDISAMFYEYRDLSLHTHSNVNVCMHAGAPRLHTRSVIVVNKSIMYERCYVNRTLFSCHIPNITEIYEKVLFRAGYTLNGKNRPKNKHVY